MTFLATNRWPDAAAERSCVNSTLQWPAPPMQPAPMRHSLASLWRQQARGAVNAVRRMCTAVSPRPQPDVSAASSRIVGRVCPPVFLKVTAGVPRTAGCQFQAARGLDDGWMAGVGASLPPTTCSAAREARQDHARRSGSVYAAH